MAAFSKSKLITISEGILLTNPFKKSISQISLQNHYKLEWIQSPLLAVFAAELKNSLVVDTVSKAIVPVYDWRVLGFNAVFIISSDECSESLDPVNQTTNPDKGSTYQYKGSLDSIKDGIKECLEKCPIDIRLELGRNT